MPLGSCLLKSVKILLHLSLKITAGILGTKAVQKSPNCSMRPAQCVLDTSLPLKASRVLSAEVILDYRIADDNVAKGYLLIFRRCWCSSTDTTTKASSTPV